MILQQYHFAADDMMKTCEEGPIFEPKFIFYKTNNWKKIDKESQKAFEFLIKKVLKKILKSLIHHHILMKFLNFIK